MSDLKMGTHHRMNEEKWKWKWKWCWKLKRSWRKKKYMHVSLWLRLLYKLPNNKKNTEYMWNNTKPIIIDTNHLFSVRMNCQNIYGYEWISPNVWIHVNLSNLTYFTYSASPVLAISLAFSYSCHLHIIYRFPFGKFYSALSVAAVSPVNVLMFDVFFHGYQPFMHHWRIGHRGNLSKHNR